MARQKDIFFISVYAYIPVNQINVAQSVDGKLVGGELSSEDEGCVSQTALTTDGVGGIHDWCLLTLNTTSLNKVIRSSPTEAHSFIHPLLLTHTHTYTLFLPLKHTQC